MLDKSSMHRLIGAGIMLVAAVCILPLILDGERPNDLGVSVSSPPPAPNITTVKINPVQKLPEVKKGSTDKSLESDKPKVVRKVIEPKGKAKEDVVAASPVVEKKDTKAPSSKKEATQPQTTPPKPVVKKLETSTAKPARWVVQIASFKNRNNASALVKKLQKANYAAYIITTKTLYKVFVGPEIKKRRSEQIKQEIKQKFRLEGFVVKYSEN
ncbi:SPOR domain-containing protein [Marinomonas agarivorans]|nr:SPOR domain-containing protein [Marinomonas agarivorans]